MIPVNHLPTLQWAESEREEYGPRCLSGVLAHEAEVGGGNDRFRAVGHLQRLEDGGDVNFYRRFGKVEDAGDSLVALALHHQGEHLYLPFGQTKIGGRGPSFNGRECYSGHRSGLAAIEYFGRNVDSA